MTALLVAAGAALGAPLRYLIDRAVQARVGPAFPWGTFAVNVCGSLLLGLLAAGAFSEAVPDGWMALLGTGFCGALTTYSTFGYETVRLIERGTAGHALLNVLGSITAGLGAAALGAMIGFACWA